MCCVFFFFFSLKNFLPKIKGMGREVYLAEERQQPKRRRGTNEPKLTLTADLGMSDVCAMRQHLPADRSMQTTLHNSTLSASFEYAVD